MFPLTLRVFAGIIGLMKKATHKKKEIHNRGLVSRIVVLLKLIKELDHPSLDKLARALEDDHGFRRPCKRTLFRDILYLRDSCNYPIFFDREKGGYRLDPERGRREGFAQEVQDPTSVLGTTPAHPRQAAISALPEGESVSATARWAALKIEAWQRAGKLEPTQQAGVVYRGCQILEGLLARCVSVLLGIRVQTDDLAVHGRFEEQMQLLQTTNEELTELIKKRQPKALKGQILLSVDDFCLLRNLGRLREAILSPGQISIQEMQHRITSSLQRFLPDLLAFVNSPFVRTCGKIDL